MSRGREANPRGPRPRSFRRWLPLLAACCVMALGVTMHTAANWTVQVWVQQTITSQSPDIGFGEGIAAHGTMTDGTEADINQVVATATDETSGANRDSQIVGVRVPLGGTNFWDFGMVLSSDVCAAYTDTNQILCSVSPNQRASDATARLSDSYLRINYAIGYDELLDFIGITGARADCPPSGGTVAEPGGRIVGEGGNTVQVADIPAEYSRDPRPRVGVEILATTGGLNPIEVTGKLYKQEFTQVNPPMAGLRVIAELDGRDTATVPITGDIAYDVELVRVTCAVGTTEPVWPPYNGRFGITEPGGGTGSLGDILPDIGSVGPGRELAPGSSGSAGSGPGSVQPPPQPPAPLPEGVPPLFGPLLAGP
jgi:hypothetical protein